MHLSTLRLYYHLHHLEILTNLILIEQMHVLFNAYFNAIYLSAFDNAFRQLTSYFLDTNKARVLADATINFISDT